MFRKINKDDKKEKEQIEKIWLKRSIEVHRFVAPDPAQFWRDRLTQFQKDTNSEKVKGYVYETDGLVKGFITFSYCKGHIYIYEVFAYESGKGYGNKLLNKVKDLGKPDPLTVHVLAVKWYLGQGFVIIQPHESNLLKQEIDVLKKEIEGIQELGKHDTVKEKELKYKRQQLKYLMIYPNYFVNKS